MTPGHSLAIIRRTEEPGATLCGDQIAERVAAGLGIAVETGQEANHYQHGEKEQRNFDHGGLTSWREPGAALRSLGRRGGRPARQRLASIHNLWMRQTINCLWMHCQQGVDMSATTELFDAWKTARGFASDRAAAHALHLTAQTVNNWRTRDGNAEAHVIEKMAGDLGKDPVPYILKAFAEAAKSAEAKKSLGRLARRLGAACVALLALAPWMLGSNAQAAHTAPQNGSAYTLCAMGIRVALAAFARRWRLWTAPRLQPHDMEPVQCNHLASCLSSP